MDESSVVLVNAQADARLGKQDAKSLVGDLLAEMGKPEISTGHQHREELFYAVSNRREITKRLAVSLCVGCCMVWSLTILTGGLTPCLFFWDTSLRHRSIT